MADVASRAPFHLGRAASEGSLTRQRALQRRASGTPGARPARPSPPAGVSAGFLAYFCCEHRPPEDAPPERRSTRGVVLALKKAAQEAGTEGPLVDRLHGESHFVTGGPLCGPAPTHVAHAWDAGFSELTSAIIKDAGGDLDRRYSIDLFSADLHTPPEDPVAVVQAAVAGAEDVLLVLDAKGEALTRLWVLFEALLAHDSGKLRVRCCAPEGFGASEDAYRRWEAQIDAMDWVLAQATRKSDEKRLRAFAERVWETQGKGLERMQAQLKRTLRKEVYGRILVGAVNRGDGKAVQALLDGGASPDQQDEFGNTVQELAASLGSVAIEEAIFERRMLKGVHRPLSDFFGARELLDACHGVDQDILAPFVTEVGADDLFWEEEELAQGEVSGERFLLGTGRQSDRSTRTPGSPGSTQREWNFLALAGADTRSDSGED